MMKLVASIVILLTLSMSFSAKADSPASGPEGQERKTPAEWLKVIAAQNVECKKYEEEHPKETSILYGATQVYTSYRDMQYLPRWPDKYQQGYKAYQEWWKSKGEAAFKKWRQDGFPVTTDNDYLILHLVAMNDLPFNSIQPGDADLVKYRAGIVKRGRELFLQGCTGKGLSKSELAELRLLAMYDLWSWSGPHFRLYGAGYYADPISYDPNTPSSIGTVAPDFTLPRMEEILGRSSYSDDKNPFDEMNVFRPAILTGVLEIMNGYEANTDPQKSPYPIQSKPYDNEFKDPVTLSSFRGKKPVLLLFADPTDTWTYCGTVAPYWGPLYQAIEGHVAVFFVHVTVHDPIMAASWNSAIYIPGQRALHPNSLEAPLEARARTAKLCYMGYPTLSVPYLLDDLSEHALNDYSADGGGALTALVDKNGIISLCANNRECGSYLSEDMRNGRQSERHVMAFRLHLMNLIESNLKVLLDAGGVWNKQMKLVIPDWTLSPSVENVPLTSVDVPSGLITVTGTNGKPLTIAVDRRSRIVLGPKLGTIADLKPGQIMSIYYQDDPGNKVGRMARLVATPDVYASQDAIGWWVPAVVRSIDADKGTIQAKVTLSLRDSKSLAFWKTAGPEMIRMLGGNQAPQIEKILATEQGRVLSLHTDRATELFIDGMKAKLSDLKPGDKLGFNLNDFQSENVLPTVIRAYRY
jgi:hypothetical protein